MDAFRDLLYSKKDVLILVFPSKSIQVWWEAADPLQIGA
jgi:hypothetical protein